MNYIYFSIELILILINKTTIVIELWYPFKNKNHLQNSQNQFEWTIFIIILFTLKMIFARPQNPRKRLLPTFSGFNPRFFFFYKFNNFFIFFQIHESSEQIWRRQRYELLLDYYNNPGRPVTPPFSLLLSIYWLIKYVVLRFKNVSEVNARKTILYPRIFGQHFLRLPREEPTSPEMAMPNEFA